jgi:intracellular sulfur oxidation DsrE/DsrF family protein
MKHRLLTIIFALTAFIAQAQTKVNPVIKNFGTVTEVPFADEMPDPKLDYKILVEVTSDNTHPQMVHEYFEKVAAVVNLHALAGIPANRLHVVMVIHSAASAFVINNENYRKTYGVDNPNIPLFKELTDAGVKIFVCGQSLNKHKLTKNDIAPEVKVALSAITTLTSFQLKGYALLKY